MFKLYCKHIETGEPAILTYDIKDNKITDENGVDLILSIKEDLKTKGLQIPTMRADDVVIPFSPDMPLKKSSDVSSLKIQLGLKCNYSCAYCNQADQVGNALDTNIDDAKEFLENLDKWLTSVPGRIEFWGGEPFVYWKKLLVLVPAIREKFPNARLVIITNGSLIDDEKIDFIEKYDISVTISHDGPGQPLRGPDPLDEPGMKERWLRFFERRKGHVGINSVLTAGNHDLSKIREWFHEKLGGDFVGNGLEGIVNAHEDGLDSTVFSEADYLSMQENIFFSLWNRTEPSNSPYVRRAKGFMQTLLSGRTSDTLWQKCGMDRENNLAVDLKGNVMTCHNTASVGKHYSGSVFDMENVEVKTSWHWSQRKECSHCPMLYICQGSCMYLEDNAFAISCENEYNYAKPIFAFVLAYFFGYSLLDIKGDIIRPKIKKTIPIAVASH